MSTMETSSPARSVRVDQQVWDSARERARAERTTISAVVQKFVKGYGLGYIDPPITRVEYTPTDVVLPD